MIKVDCPEPPARVARLLGMRSNRNTRWESRNSQRATDAEMNLLLRQAFHRKCGYCERVIGDGTIDHFWPKELYPERVWDWNNYILACTDCQLSKLAQPPVDAQGHQIINSREDEPLRYIRIAPDGRMFAIMPAGVADPRGSYTLTLLQLDQRPDLDLERCEKFNEVLGLIAIIIHPEATAPIIGEAWRLLQDTLGAHRPHLAIIQQLFTVPTGEVRVQTERFYRVIPESHNLLAHFRRPV
jgi:uncharacterized protein (TIGR02646 family)